MKKYGSTKNISKVINQRLKSRKNHTGRGKKRLYFRVKKEFANMDTEVEVKNGWKDNIEWKL
jgi:hypothetical protein